MPTPPRSAQALVMVLVPAMPPEAGMSVLRKPTPYICAATGRPEAASHKRPSASDMAQRWECLLEGHSLTTDADHPWETLAPSGNLRPAVGRTVTGCLAPPDVAGNYQYFTSRTPAKTITAPMILPVVRACCGRFIRPKWSSTSEQIS